MKRRILFLAFMAVIAITMQANAQKIIITGAMVQNTADTVLGGGEFIQLMATEEITFGPSSPYSVIVSRYSTDKPDEIGWTAVTSYQFNLTEEITVNKGELFYVGGAAKAMRTLANGDHISLVSSKWARSKDYFEEAGDSGQGEKKRKVWDDNTKNNQGLMNNNRPNMIGVFDTRNVTATTKPIDMAVFVNTNGVIADAYCRNIGTVEAPIYKGYKVPDNDHYDSSVGDGYFGKDSLLNTATFLGANASNAFQKLVGSYNSDAQTWTTNRVKTPIALTASSTASTIETGTVFTLPVTLTGFTAKAQRSSVMLNWSTASEQNNARFDIYRSRVAGDDFKLVGSVAGSGTISRSRQYSYTDNSPQAGINYYKLVQVDNDGKKASSDVVFANVGAKLSSVAVSAANGNVNLLIYTAKRGAGKVSLHDVSGRKLTSQRIELVNGYTTIAIPVQLQQNGIYIVVVETEIENIREKFMY